MSKLWKNVLVLWTIGMGLGMSGVVQGATGAGPYYATPSWAQQLPASTRFVVLSNWGTGNEAVLDRETGLVWEQPQSTTTFNWLDASFHCVTLSKDGRKGWRLPTIQDLASLIDPTTSDPSLPSGHPFSNVRQFGAWSATSRAGNASGAWGVDFNDGVMGVIGKDADFLLRAWCVRGGPGVDPQ